MIPNFCDDFLAKEAPGSFGVVAHLPPARSRNRKAETSGSFIVAVAAEMESDTIKVDAPPPHPVALPTQPAAVSKRVGRKVSLANSFEWMITEDALIRL